jgi:hypothetical protein
MYAAAARAEHRYREFAEYPCVNLGVASWVLNEI